VAAQKEIKTDRRNQILFLAGEIFSRKGFHNASVSDIIQRAGIARGTFYLYFANKRDIFDSLLNEVVDELRDRIRPIDLQQGQPDPIVQLKENLHRVFEFLTQNPALTQILLHHAAGLDQKTSNLLKTFYGRVLDMIQSSLDHGIRMGLVRPCDTRILASGVMGIMKEVADQLTGQPQQNPPIDQVVEELITFGLWGVFVQPRRA